MPRESPLTEEEGLAILMRDRFRCHYCGLDGTASFDNAMMMTVDFVVPRADGGTKEPSNLVTACRTCNRLKGRHDFLGFEKAKDFVLQRREQRRWVWEHHMATLAEHKTSS